MDLQGIQISESIDCEEQIGQIAQVYYDAFDLKIWRLVLFPESKEQALRLLAHSFNLHRGLYAIHQGQVVGLVGLGNRNGGFMEVGLSTLRSEFSRWGALRRYWWSRLILALQPLPKNVLHVEALAVAKTARGMGIGSLLLKRVFEYARQEGYPSILLEVVDTNIAAKRLYERLGFRVTRYDRFGPFTRQAGFSGSYQMEKEI
jgi:ribosomal protein S18 acetylase RimI-like enzyme